jgi:hypothetical protein
MGDVVFGVGPEESTSRQACNGPRLAATSRAGFYQATEAVTGPAPPPRSGGQIPGRAPIKGPHDS